MKTFEHKDTLSIIELYRKIVKEKLGREILGWYIEDTVQNFRGQGFTNSFYGRKRSDIVQAQIVALEGVNKVKFDYRSINILYMFENGQYQGHEGGTAARYQIPHPNSTGCWWASIYLASSDWEEDDEDI